MPQIALLDEVTIDKIAAGEVVERPSSVVKELVENAIDAGSTAITVEIKEGGISFIRITDNGGGIDKEQVPLAFLRHSTSKIKSAEDLLNISSLGFRGEALSSISAVSRVELITKTYSQLTGTRYLIEGSKEILNEEIGAPDGTTFIVKDLFYNTPARRKFLKAAQTEASYISDLVERLALSHPDISFKFINNNQTKLHTSGNGNIRDLIYHIYGREITSSVLNINYEGELFSLKGFIGKPVKSLDAIKYKVKVDSNLWPGLNRNVRVFEPQFELTQDDRYIKEYDDLNALIEARPTDIIKNISAYGLFSINISV